MIKTTGGTCYVASADGSESAAIFEPNEGLERWAFELLLNKTEGNKWLFKRDDRIREPTDRIGSITDDGTPYLNPEIVLLFKAKNNFEKDQHDLEQVLPRLSPEAKTWFNKSLQLIHPNHPWLSRL